MKLSFINKPVEQAPKGHLRVRITEEAIDTKRLVRENGVKWLEIGGGKPADMNLRKFMRLCRSIVRTAKQGKHSKIALQFDRMPALFKNLKNVSLEDVSSIAAQNFVIADYEFTKYKSKPEEIHVTELCFCGKSSRSIEAAARRGVIIGDGTNLARTLANMPSSDMTPIHLGKEAKLAAKGLPITVTVLGKKEMEKLGMGAVLAVGKGAGAEPVFIAMEYKGARGAPTVLAGKGVTFDSGGINLKTDGGHEMHMDMSGGAAVIAAVATAARLTLKKHVVGLIPAVENMPGPHAYRIHDVVKGLSGKTIEIMNTDAEGRVILSDALAYAKKYKPSVVVDIATLTGAALVALGTFSDALFSRDDALAKTLEEAGEMAGDYVWRLPLWDEYEPAVKGTVGDVLNATPPGNRYGGAINGAMFLWQFAKDLGCPWAHIDIAPRMTASESDELAKGATGTPVRLLVRFIEEWEPA